jgi:hypothetical protein
VADLQKATRSLQRIDISISFGSSILVLVLSGVSMRVSFNTKMSEV